MVLSEAGAEVIGNVGILVTVLQALGGVLILYLVFNIINAIINRHRNQEIRKINENLQDIKRLLRKKRKSH